MNALIPHPSDFAHPSKIHGQAHVGRVMVHAFRLIEATGMTDEASRLWGAVYLHDLARTHDGFDEVHGMHAVMRVNESTDLQERLIARGVQSDDPSMLLAVMMHCLPDDHSAFGGKPVWPLLAMLKDVNAPRSRAVRRSGPVVPAVPGTSRGMVKFAEDLYSQSHRRVKEGPNFFTDLLKVAERILGKPVTDSVERAGRRGQAREGARQGPRVPAAAPVKPGAKPVAGKPGAVKPGATKPVAGKPVAAKPVAAKPAALKPAPKASATPAPKLAARAKSRQR